ncbi:hypothetical protein [Gynuella sunshinyii]|nr:hypothetical protein [Gynuella sunshinyii]
MIVETQLEEWLGSIVDTGMPILLPQDELEQFGANEEAFAKYVRSDPLLAMQILLWSKRTKTAPQGAIVNVSDAIAVLGVNQTLQRAAKLERLDPQQHHNKRLLEFIVDSMVAASLLESWHDLRQVEWTETDYWACVFANAVWWLMAVKDPVLLEGIEYRVSSGEPVNQVFEGVLGFSYQDLVVFTIDTYMLPTLERIMAWLENEETPPAGLNFKYQALRFFLPISHQLAGSCREEYGSDRYLSLVKKAANATLIDNFEANLPVWIGRAIESYHDSLIGYSIKHGYAAILTQHPEYQSDSYHSSAAGDSVNGITKWQSRLLSRLLEQLMNLLQGKCCFIAFPDGDKMRLEVARGGGLEKYLDYQFAIPKSGWLLKMLTASSSIRIAKDKAGLAMGQLPEDVRQLISDDLFYMKSFSVNNDRYGLVYFMPDENREVQQEAYMQFRRLVALTEKNFMQDFETDLS